MPYYTYFPIKIIPLYSSIEKIKSTGSTYMAASGLIPSNAPEKPKNEHVFDMVDYALELFLKITIVNEHSFNNFRMRIGINVGSVVAGVIGSRKPQYGKLLSSLNRYLSVLMRDFFVKRYYRTEILRELTKLPSNKIR